MTLYRNEQTNSKNLARADTDADRYYRESIDQTLPPGSLTCLEVVGEGSIISFLLIKRVISVVAARKKLRADSRRIVLETDLNPSSVSDSSTGLVNTRLSVTVVVRK